MKSQHESVYSNLYYPPYVSEQRGTSAFNASAGYIKDTFTKAAPPSSADETRRVVTNLIGSYVRCILTDGRALVGKFTCIDRSENMILCDVVEYRPIPREPNGWEDSARTAVERQGLSDPILLPPRCVERHLSQAMVPGKRLVRVLVEPSTWNTVLSQPSQTTYEEQSWLRWRFCKFEEFCTIRGWNSRGFYLVSLNLMFLLERPDSGNSKCLVSGTTRNSEKESWNLKSFLQPTVNEFMNILRVVASWSATKLS